MKKIFLSFFVALILVSLAPSILAQQAPRGVEVGYPEVGGAQTPETVTTPVPEYVKYIFNAAIWVSGLLALIILVYAGFQWFTSSGSPERIREAKDRIKAALLGLLILFGSYLILTSINPELVVFHLKRLKPIISSLPSGVLVCKKPVEVDQAWDITINYPYYNDEKTEVQKAKELDQILEIISDNCYAVASKGNIIPDFDNKITDIYFIPGIEQGYGVTYGAIVYEETGYNGKSKVLYEHMNWWGNPKHYSQNEFNVKVSSAKPFVIQWQPDPNWKVILYEDYNFNKDSNLTPAYYSLQGTQLWREVPLKSASSTGIEGYGGSWSQNWSPKSIKIEGNLTAILSTDDGRREIFFAESDSNLEDNENIIKQVACTDYKTQKIIKQDCIVAGGFGQNVTYMPCCGEAAATQLLILSAKPY